MKRLLINLIINLFLLINSFSGITQTIKNQVFYRLRSGEQIIFSDEHRLRLYNGKIGSLLFTEILSGKDTGQYIILNGKVLGPYQKIFYPEIFNFEQTGNFKVVVQKKNQYYLNLNSNEVGPFDGLFESGLTGNGHYYLHSETNGNEYLTINNKVLGKYIDLANIKLLDNGNFLFTHRRNDKWITNINGREYTTNEQLEQVSLKGDGHYCYAYQSDSIWYVIVDGNKHGPYELVSELTLAENGDFGFITKLGSREFANINGRMNGPYARILPTTISLGRNKKLLFVDHSKYCYIYQKEKQQYIMMNGKPLGPFDYIDEPKIMQNGIFAFIYRNNAQNFANINGKSYGPYEKIIVAYDWLNSKDLRTYSFPIISEKGDFCFKYQNKQKSYINLNGKEIGYDIKENYNVSNETDGSEKFRSDILFSTNYKNYIIYCADNYDIIINGDKYYSSGGFAYYYSETNNSFRWLSLKGRELLLNDYSLNKK